MFSFTRLSQIISIFLDELKFLHCFKNPNNYKPIWQKNKQCIHLKNE